MHFAFKTFRFILVRVFCAFVLHYVDTRRIEEELLYSMTISSMKTKN